MLGGEPALGSLCSPRVRRSRTPAWGLLAPRLTRVRAPSPFERQDVTVVRPRILAVNRFVLTGGSLDAEPIPSLWAVASEESGGAGQASLSVAS